MTDSHSSAKRTSLSSFSFCLALVLNSYCLATLAQQPTTSAPTPTRARRPAPVESVHRPLQTWPNSVPIPLPPDAKFVAGYQSQYLNTKSMTFFRFTTINAAAAVIDWYKRSLQSAGWTMRETASSQGRSVSSISALKNGVSCSINVLAPLTPKDRTAVQISYTDR